MEKSRPWKGRGAGPAGKQGRRLWHELLRSEGEVESSCIPQVVLIVVVQAPDVLESRQKVVKSDRPEAHPLVYFDVEAATGRHPECCLRRHDPPGDRCAGTYWNGRAGDKCWGRTGRQKSLDSVAGSNMCPTK